MKKFALLAGIALIAACSQKSEAPPADEATSEAAVASAPAAVETPAAGTYDVVGPDGTKGVSILNADGSYEDQDAAGKTVAKGKWAIKDGKTCFMPEGGAEECYTESARGADGSFTATDAKGGITKVAPRAK